MSLAIARRVGDTRALGAVIHDTIHVYWFPTTLDRRKALAEEEIRIAASVADPAMLFHAWMDVRHVAMATFDIERALFADDEVERLATESGQPGMRWTASGARAAQMLFAGDLDGAEEKFDEMEARSPSRLRTFRRCGILARPRSS